jgi:acetylornithine deacetylase/succinyl-diaminopimelate desuccinylase-like protein
MNRRTFLKEAAAGALATAFSNTTGRAESLEDIRTQIQRGHSRTVQRLQDWVRLPSIAAENRGMSEGCDFAMQLLREAGFDRVTRVPTDGQPGIFATVDAGAARSVGVYFMYDVKQVTPTEWSSPPWDAALINKPGLGQVLVGRGAVNQKGPEASFLAALEAIRAAGRKLPVNLVLVAEGEEEIGSPHITQIVRRPEVEAVLRRCAGIFVPAAAQGIDGIISINLGAKGWLELELTASGARWGRGPRKDIHSSNKARVDSPAWHLVQALHTLVSV